MEVDIKPVGKKQVVITITSDADIGVQRMIKALAHICKVLIDQHGLEMKDCAISPTDKVTVDDSDPFPAPEAPSP